MIVLSGATSVLRLITSSAAGIDVFASFADLAGGTATADAQATAIASATTTTIVASPASGARRNMRFMSARNTHATTANTVALQVFDGAAAHQIYKAVLAAGEALIYDEANGFQVIGATGIPKVAQGYGGGAAVVSELNVVVLGADVVNNNAVANTLQDVTGFGFPVVAGETYWFEMAIDYTAAATTTGSRWTLNGPSIGRLAYWGQTPLTATSITTSNNANLWGLPAASNTSSASTAGNIALLGGVFTPTVDGVLQVQFASEVAGSAIIAKKGSTLRWMRTA